MIIIALSGKKRSGKDTTAMIIEENVSGKTAKLGFADALKEEVAASCGVTVEFLNEHKDNFRLILQGWGSDFRRELFSKIYWIERLEDKLETLRLQKVKVAIVTDVRFRNEADMLRKMGAFLIRINRPFSGKLDQHPSEIDLDDYKHFDATIDNESTIDFLQVKVKAMLEQLKIK